MPGVTHVSDAFVLSHNKHDILKAAPLTMRSAIEEASVCPPATFAVDARRSNTDHPLSGTQMNVEIGDGLLLLSGSAEVSVQSSGLSGNARAQAIVDAPDAGIVFGANTVDATGGQWEGVVQNGGIPVTVPAEDLSVAPLLPVPGDPIVVPTLGP